MKDTSFRTQAGCRADRSEKCAKKGAKRFMAVLMMAMMLMALTACGEKENDAAATPTVAPTEAQEPTVTPEPVATEAPEYPMTVVLPDGTELTLAEEVQTIVSMGPNITEILYAIGAGDKLIGRTDYCDYPAEVSAVASVGSIYTPDVEKIVELNPDMVIGSTHFKDESAQKLEEMGIQTVTLYSPSEMDGVYDLILTLGELTGCEEAATALAEETKAKIEAVKSEAALSAVAPTVYYVVGYGEYGDYTAGGDTFIGQMITEAGGVNIAKDVSGWSYTLEALLEADPDIIIVGLGEAEGFKTAANYCELSAVKNDRVYEIDRNLLDRQGYRNAEGMETLAEIFQSVAE